MIREQEIDKNEKKVGSEVRKKGARETHKRIWEKDKNFGERGKYHQSKGKGGKRKGNTGHTGVGSLKLEKEGGAKLHFKVEQAWGERKRGKIMHREKKG